MHDLIAPPVVMMETGVNPVIAGNGPGWVSGTPANLAAGTSTNVLVLFDLGPNWQNYTMLQAIINGALPSSGLTGFQLFSRDDPAVAINMSRRLFQANGSGSTISLAITSGSAIGTTARPMGRYLIASMNNADATNAQGTGAKVTLAMYRA
jgi:hypothetical protein